MNDADRLSLDPVMRWNIGEKAVERQAASSSQMGRFETELLAADANVEALADMNGAWIDKVHDRHQPTKIVLDMDSSISPTHGDQEGMAFNGLQSPRQSGAVHQGRQVRDQMDTAHVASLAFRPLTRATTPSGSSFTPWPTIWVTSCGRWPCRRRWNTGR